MAANSSAHEEGKSFADDCGGEPRRAPRPADSGGPTITNQATSNVTTTNSFVNVGQVIQISGDNNTVFLSRNRAHVMQQNQTTLCQRCGDSCTQAGHTSTAADGGTACSHPPSTTNRAQDSSRCGLTSIQRPSQVSRATYAPGPPKRLEIVTLTTKLTGTVGNDWKLLAVPLSIDDADVNSTDHEERGLKSKINKLLTMWVDRDEENDRTKLAQLLGSLDGYDLAKDCQLSLKNS